MSSKTARSFQHTPAPRRARGKGKVGARRRPHAHGCHSSAAGKSALVPSNQRHMRPREEHWVEAMDAKPQGDGVACEQLLKDIALVRCRLVCARHASRPERARDGGTAAHQ
jgi:hypothetical protein